MRQAAAICAGGAVGALARTGLSVTVSSLWVTFAVNVVGAFALGYFVTRLQERLPLSAYKRPLLGTGLCGALTTFSTIQIDVLNLLDAHAYARAAAYLIVTIVSGYLAVMLATALVRRTRVIA